MRIARKLSADQEIIQHFLTVLGGAMIELSSNKLARPEFFIQAHAFIKEYIEGRFFKKEELLIKTLEDVGFPPDDGPVGFMRSEQVKSQKAAAHLIHAAEQWKAGDDSARVDVGWASSEYTSVIRQHLERLKTLIFPLLEQNMPIEEEHLLSEKVDKLALNGDLQGNLEQYIKMVLSLEEELSDWR
jgi:hemerythrin-like domain-containing protein